MSEDKQEHGADLLADRLALRDRQLDAIARISVALYSQVEADDLIAQILDVSLEIASADAGSILIYDAKTDELEFRYVVGEAKSQLTGVRMPCSKGICGRVFNAGEAEITADASSDADHEKEIGERVDYKARNLVTVPLKTAEGDVIGVMQILNKRGGLFVAADLEVLSILATQAAMAIEHVELMQRARVAEIVKKIGDISHDVKNLMTPVESGIKTLEMIFEDAFDGYDGANAGGGASSMAELLAAQGESFETLREFFPEVVLMVLEGASNVTSRAREIADAIKGQVARPVFEMVDLNDVIKSVVRPLKLVAERHSIRLDCDGLGELRPGSFDRKLIYNAVYNLINNAIPETPQGGTIFVRTSIREAEGDEGAAAIVEVEDTGRGIPEEVRARLFTEDAVSTKPGGTGLGTKIVKNAVDAHDGTITVESEIDRGSTFTIELPLRAGAHATPSPSDAG
jgi:signal transduction histidine kinase